MGMGKGMMGMDCDMDVDGNCLIDSATCAAMMADGKIDSADCLRMENGKCAINSSACMKSMHAGKMMGMSSAECKAACEAKGIDCSDPAACPEMMKSCSMHGKMKCSEECMEDCKAKGIDCSDAKACPSMKKDCCKK